MDIHFIGAGPDVQKVSLPTTLALSRMHVITAALILQRYRKHRMAALGAGECYVIPMCVGGDFGPAAIHDQVIGDFHQEARLSGCLSSSAMRMTSS